MTIPPTTLTAQPTRGTTDPAAVRRGRSPFLTAHPRLAFILKRVLRAVVSLLIVLVASFFLVHLVPGDPVRAALGPTAPVASVNALTKQLGLDRPLWAQFGRYVGELLRGDLGTSVSSQQSVAGMLGDRLPATLWLSIISFVLAIAAAFPIGVATAVSARSGRRRGVDLGISGFLGVLIAVPNFLLAVLLVAAFSIGLHAFPPAGWGAGNQVVLPVLALALGPMAYLARIVHVEMLRVLDAPYITTARSKRLPARLLYLRHALPNIVAASLTAGGVVLVGLVAGTVIVETVFVIPGIGSTIVSSIEAKDYPLIQGVVLVYAILVLGANLVIDLALAILDPRSSIAEA